MNREEYYFQKWADAINDGMDLKAARQWATDQTEYTFGLIDAAKKREWLHIRDIPDEQWDHEHYLEERGLPVGHRE